MGINESQTRDLIRQAKQEIPSPTEIFDLAWAQCAFTESFVRNSFCNAILRLETEAYGIFLRHQKQAVLSFSKGWIELQKPSIRRELERVVAERGWDRFVDKAAILFAEFGEMVRGLELSLGNMRKSRGGKTFEWVIVRLLDHIGVRAEMPGGEIKRQLGRVDIVVPSANVALETPDRAIFLTCKRTLRERWKQEVPQARPNQRVYLLTIDEDVSSEKAQEINQKSLIAFVRDDVATKVAFANMRWVRPLSDLPKAVSRL
ncbi:MAG: hypothetical protein JW759_03810 [Candidatus Coatesbacteria bacterium]|nr:hypothetical protein [Candidatus Coatesbacteria bacterium]